MATNSVNIDHPVVVVGAGISGLSCARTLHGAGIPVVILDAAPRVGGRVASDHLDGFVLDRGFQVLLTAYPEAIRALDYRSLQLHRFYAGALIQVQKRRYRFADPLKHPIAALGTLRAPIASLGDCMRIMRLRSAAQHRNANSSRRTQTTTRELLEMSGFSARVIERFFKPFFGGVFLDRNLQTPSWFFDFVFSMFAGGPAALPAGGMQRIAEQLAGHVPGTAIRLQSPVERVSADGVVLASGEHIPARCVVVAVDADTAGQWFPNIVTSGWNSTTTIYYAAPHSPLNEAILLLNGNGSGLINHVCVPSDVSTNYAPPGRSLVSVSIIGIPEADDAKLDALTRAELQEWFGPQIDLWDLLRIYRIRRALPQCAGEATRPSAKFDNVYFCGDYLEDPSINGALRSGRLTAEDIERVWHR